MNLKPSGQSEALVTGYLHPNYTQALSAYGTPLELPASGGWLLKRPVTGTDYHDAMGSYPLFCCQDWTQLGTDLENLGQSLVSLTLVTDPFGDYTPELLQRSFNQFVRPFKEHFVLDMQRPLEETTSKSHRKKARHALKSVQVEAIENPVNCTDEWTALYDNLIERHNLHGIHAFSRESFAQQLDTPSAVFIRASYEGETIGGQIFFIQGDVVHCHLGALTPLGYELGGFYAIDYFSIDYCSSRARWYNLGGGAGVSAGQNGLTQYKQGWSSETRSTYLCGHIFDRAAYDDIIRLRQTPETNYFPAYRQGEFG